MLERTESMDAAAGVLCWVSTVWYLDSSLHAAERQLADDPRIALFLGGRLRRAARFSTSSTALVSDPACG